MSISFSARKLIPTIALTLLLAAESAGADSAEQSELAAAYCQRENTTVVQVVALEQVYVYNRFGAFNPAGMMYALRRDVVFSGDESEAEPDEDVLAGLVPGDTIPVAADLVTDTALAGNVRLRSDKRPRPIVLRVNEGDCLHVSFTNLLSPVLDGDEYITDPQTGRIVSMDSDEPATRAASMHVNGLELSGSIGSDGTNVGFNLSSLVNPGETVEYTWIARKEGGYLLYSMGASAGGEGDGGQLGLGLFGSVNVEPRGSLWYRSQITEDQLATVQTSTSAQGTPIIDDYDATDAEGVPILAMTRPLPLEDPRGVREIVHTDINAIIDVRATGENCHLILGPGSSCGEPFREFTVIFHDEITAVQAFRELDDEENPISALKDGMGINYGAAGLGAMVLANRMGIGPAKDCVECKLEEFFLTSWAMGDPALVIERDANQAAIRALYPDDPSNVHHSYLGDAVRFRNLHAGPKETHVFHLHAHQWTQDWHDPDSVYLDSQTISPGASFTYEVHYGGSGNRNLTPGDSIFHCHLYPHFAQGMWELWRTHDVFEAGTPDRNLPDGEIAAGTPNPAVVPLPDTPLPPMPTPSFKGYPFYIAGVPGHRPPQAPLDIDPSVYAEDTDNTLMRHVIVDGARETGANLFGQGADGEPTDLERRYFDTSIPEDSPLGQANRVAARVRAENASPDLFLLAAKLTEAAIIRLPLDGTTDERAAMDFHAGTAPGAVVVARSDYGVPERGYPTCTIEGNCGTPEIPLLFRVNGYEPKPGAPFADPCPTQFYVGDYEDDPANPANWALLAPERRYRATYLQFDMPVNRHGWHDPQARIITLEEDAAAILDHTRAPEPFFFRANSGECIVFEATNLIPSNLNLDDFQVFSPTDTIGQHIHLVKFDVTSSDGSGNGWNYEDGTFSPDEIRERIIANNTYRGFAELRPLTHRLFRDGGPLDTGADGPGACPGYLPADPVAAEHLLEDRPWCGAQSTFQRWWADPLLNQNGIDRTIRTVFTHDHFGPSSHQQHGFYAALVIEPNGSSWNTMAGEPFGGQDPVTGIRIPGRDDGGPTSWAATIVGPRPDGEHSYSHREYNVAVADFALLYTAPPANRPISPPGQLDHDLPEMVFNGPLPRPEGISLSDPGGQLLNYRNEPVPGRIGTENAEGRWSLRRYDPASAEVAACKAALEVGQQVGNEMIPVDSLTQCREGTSDPTAAEACEARVVKALCDPSDLANAFSSFTHAGQDISIRAAIAADSLAYDTRRIFLDSYLSPDCDAPGAYCTEPPGVRNPGDPGTPILTAREGDDVLVRLIQGAQEENHIFFMNGIKWLAEPGSENSGYRAAQAIGISEHFEFNINIQDPSPQMTTDRLYGTTATDNIWDGQFGLMRVLGSQDDVANLPPLTTNAGDDNLIAPGQLTCGNNTPLRHFDVEAWRLRDLGAALNRTDLLALPYHGTHGVSDPNAMIYILKGEHTIQNGTKTVILTPAQSPKGRLTDSDRIPEPLILRARAGECIEVQLTNMLGNARENTEHPANWSWNMMPPIANGLNFNQVPASTAVGLHAQLIAGSAVRDDGSNVGTNISSLAYPCAVTVPPDGSGYETQLLNDPDVLDPVLEDCGGGGNPDLTYLWDNRQTYLWYAGDWTKAPNESEAQLTPIEFGAIGLQNFADPIKGASHGLIGALVIEPADATWQTDCEILQDADAELPSCLDAAATVNSASGSFREFVLIYQNDASLRYRGEALANLRNGDDAEDSGQKAFNYRLEPFWARLNANPAADPDAMSEYDFADVLSSKPEDGHGDPVTPLFTAAAGTEVRFRIVEPAGHPRNGGFAVSGHDWVEYPWIEGSTVQDANPRATTPGDPDTVPQNRLGTVNGIGPGRHVNVLIGPAGGREALPGDYLYRTPVGFAFGGGQWGIMRIFDPEDCAGGVITDSRTGLTQVCQ